jgi:hypothetical protein
MFTWAVSLIPNVNDFNGQFPNFSFSIDVVNTIKWSRESGLHLKFIKLNYEQGYHPKKRRDWGKNTLYYEYSNRNQLTCKTSLKHSFILTLARSAASWREDDSYALKAIE